MSRAWVQLGEGVQSHTLIYKQMVNMNMRVMDKSTVMQISVDIEHKAVEVISEAVMHLGPVCQHVWKLVLIFLIVIVLFGWALHMEHNNFKTLDKHQAIITVSLIYIYYKHKKVFAVFVFILQSRDCLCNFCFPAVIVQWGSSVPLWVVPLGGTYNSPC